MSEDLKEQALAYHRLPQPGKLAVVATKPLTTQRDLALAYSPGVAYACEAIVANPAEAATVTSRANLVAVVTNGTAVLGLGSIGPLAAKPVMEGKAVLFKKFAGIDVFDLEINEKDPAKLVEIVASLEPTFGAINLEDIKAPECFEVESKLKARLSIPVMHDDQHGTAIVVGAAFLNALRVVGKKIEDINCVSTGGGAAGLACLDLLVSLGLKREKVTLVDIDGVVYEGRKVGMNPFKDAYARKTDLRTLDEAVKGADFFLGLSGPGVLKPEMVAKMAKDPIIFALANPTPEILPEEVRSVSPNAVIATGRSDYPNQVNNVLCFPYIFRGALDVGATTINEEMKLACVKAIADLTMSESSDVVAKAYSGENLRFGADYILPKPFDPRLIVEVATAVAKAAMETGVATRPIEDFEAYRTHLNQFVFRSGLVMRPVVEQAKKDPKRLVFAEGEDERVLRAAQQLADEGIAKPILLGRLDAIERRIASLGLRIRIGEQVEAVEIGRDPRFHHYADHYRRIMQRRGVTPDYAANVVVTRNTVVAALMVKRGEADAMICGTAGRYARQLEHVINVLGRKPGATVAAAMNLLILPKGTFFLTDTYVNPEPTSEQLAEITLMAAEEVKRFGITPKVALLSHSNFGSSDTASARRMREALPLIEARDPELEVEGEMHADSALSETIRSRIFPASRLRGQANLMVLPTQDAANIAFNMLKVLGDGISVGPILLGVARAAHILTPSVTVRGLVNMGALAVVDAQLHSDKPAEKKRK